MQWESEDGVMILIFLFGLQLGVLMGAVLCIRYLRRELSAEIGPKLKRMQAQLDSLEAALNLCAFPLCRAERAAHATSTAATAVAAAVKQPDEIAGLRS
jgi:hypothetical protein